MSNSKKRISYKNFPARSPLGATILMWLLLDRLHAAQWIYGALGLLYLSLWINFFVGMYQQEETDIFESKNQIK